MISIATISPTERAAIVRAGSLAFFSGQAEQVAQALLPTRQYAWLWWRGFKRSSDFVLDAILEAKDNRAQPVIAAYRTRVAHCITPVLGYDMFSNMWRSDDRLPPELRP